jgi:hypothetical protein
MGVIDRLIALLVLVWATGALLGAVVLPLKMSRLNLVLVLALGLVGVRLVLPLALWEGLFVIGVVGVVGGWLLQSLHEESGG